ncbi:hypothetical protein Q8A67_021060 [Cirrhinus molitorella]|uniref:Uncharacterized protein n=1 Tax=Cirrhinus molitorella TaxID=172907 RepID=A0AA88TEL6_9TELE|nr:hypothetical protein Q8A67_021060 [Cirrhinus molitorella]
MGDPAVPLRTGRLSPLSDSTKSNLSTLHRVPLLVILNRCQPRPQLNKILTPDIHCQAAEGDVWMPSCEGSKVASISTSTPTDWTHWILSGSLSHAQERNQEGECVHAEVLRERELK